MFIDVLEMIFDCFESVVSSLNVPLFHFKESEVNFIWLLVSFLVLNLLFTFFLVPRAGSGLGGIRNTVSFIQSESRKNSKDSSSKKGDSNG